MIDFFSRLDKYMISRQLNDNKLTIETGISNGLIGKARKRGALSQDNISKILYTYSDLDANWLFTGQGEMLKNQFSNGDGAIKEELTKIETLTNENRLQAKIIEGMDFKISTLEKELAEMKYTQREPIVYANVADRPPELIKKQSK